MGSSRKLRDTPPPVRQEVQRKGLQGKLEKLRKFYQQREYKKIRNSAERGWCGKYRVNRTGAMYNSKTPIRTHMYTNGR